MEKISLYIHIPFCVQKCTYCDFTSGPCSAYDRSKYVNTLIEEIKLQSERLQGVPVHTVFMGGGTPSLLQPEQIERIGQALRDGFDMTHCEEFTFEANPGTLDVQRLKAWKRIGANRVSMGVQTMDDDLLKLLGRIHTAGVVRESVQRLKEVGFDNFNLDLMFGIPTQTLSDVEETLREILELKPTHISAYSLKLEEGTVLDKAVTSGELAELDEEVDREMYHLIVQRLAEAGLDQYEISNFAKPGCASKHNLVYWRNQPYVGLGVAAHGCLQGRREAAYVDIESWEKDIASGQLPIDQTADIDRTEEMFETVMLGLRLNEGLGREAFQSRYGKDVLDIYADALTPHIENGLVIVAPDRIYLTEQGFDLSNQVFADLLPE